MTEIEVKYMKDDMTNMDNKYKEIAGVNTREEYLDNVAEEYGVDNEAVHCLADILGEPEDFDGLISMIEDI